MVPEQSILEMTLTETGEVHGIQGNNCGRAG